jgi:hypothetical protein
MKKKLLFLIFLFPSILGFSQSRDTLTKDTCLQLAGAVSSESDGVKVSCLCEIVKFHIEIYDRWEKLVYKSDSIDNTYPTNQPGYAKSHYSAYLNWNYFRLEDGKYYYVVTYSVKVNGKEDERKLKGTIDYIR